MKNFSLRKAACCAGLLGLAMTSQAQFAYNNGDVLIGFRLAATGTRDLVINAGPVSAFTNLAPGTPIPITSLTGAKIKAAFGQTNGLAWSAAACYDVFAPSYLQDTLFISRPRYDYLTQTPAWVADTATAQDFVVAKINNVGKGAVAIAPAATDSVTNTPTSLIELESWSVAPKFSYYNMVKTKPLAQDPNTSYVYANWLGTFQGNPEQLTDTLPARSDFYRITPGGPVTYLGYFEISTNATLKFFAGPSPIQSQITSVQPGPTSTVVYFTTGVTGTYTLLSSTDITLPISSWTTVSSVSGNGSVQSITDSTPAAQKFYTIQTQ